MERVAAAAPVLSTPDELSEIDEVRVRSGGSLPLEQLVRALSLSSFEEEALLLCCAPELDRAYERAFGLLLGDTALRLATVGLLTDLTALDVDERFARRQLLNRFSKLRRSGILETRGEAATEIRQELAISPLAFAFLTGRAPSAINAFRDPWQVVIPEHILLPPSAPDPAPFAK